MPKQNSQEKSNRYDKVRNGMTTIVVIVMESFDIEALSDGFEIIGFNKKYSCLVALATLFGVFVVACIAGYCWNRFRANNKKHKEALYCGIDFGFKVLLLICGAVCISTLVNNCITSKMISVHADHWYIKVAVTIAIVMLIIAIAALYQCVQHKKEQNQIANDSYPTTHMQESKIPMHTESNIYASFDLSS